MKKPPMPKRNPRRTASKMKGQVSDKELKMMMKNLGAQTTDQELEAIINAYEKKKEYKQKAPPKSYKQKPPAKKTYK